MAKKEGRRDFLKNCLVGIITALVSLPLFKNILTKKPEKGNTGWQKAKFFEKLAG